MYAIAILPIKLVTSVLLKNLRALLLELPGFSIHPVLREVVPLKMRRLSSPLYGRLASTLELMLGYTIFDRIPAPFDRIEVWGVGGPVESDNSQFSAPFSIHPLGCLVTGPRAF